MTRDLSLPAAKVTAEEKAAIQAAAAADHRTVSDFIRLTVLGAIGFEKPKRKRGR